MTCADMSNTMMRMMLRPAGHHMESMMAMMQACMTMCMACADECGQHTDMQVCMMCAEACREMASACEAMMASMSHGTRMQPGRAELGRLPPQHIETERTDRQHVVDRVQRDGLPRLHGVTRVAPDA